MATKKDYALHYFDHGLIPIPLCWVKEKECGCFHHHTDPKQIGKAPLVKFADQDIKRETVEQWFTTFPLANIGILIKQSGLVIVDADSDQAVNDFENGTAAGDQIPSVKTGRGKHYYFKTTSLTPNYRVTHTGKSQMIDIFSNGYVVAPPSVHMNGHRYTWSNPPINGFPTVPKEIENFLIKKATQNNDLEELPVFKKLKNVNLDELPLNDFMKSLIRYAEKSPYYHERGYQSRSEAIFGIIISCLKNDLTDEEICSILLNRKHAISHRFLEQKKSLSWLLKEINRAKKRAVFPKTTQQKNIRKSQ